jgi:hypothetical protein
MTEEILQARKLGAAYGWVWLKQGFWVFKQSPLLWMVLTAIFVVGTFGISTIPIVGGPLSALLLPAFFAGLMIGCDAVAHEKELELMHLFAGFQKHAAPLVTLGGINLLGNLLVFGLMMLTGGAMLIGLMTSGSPPDDQTLLQAVAKAKFALPLGMVLSFALQAIIIFASMLVVFRDIAPITALKATIRAFLDNALPLGVYGLIQLPFAILASMPMMLGWLVLLPILIASIYAVYRDMFPMKSDLATLNSAAT